MRGSGGVLFFGFDPLGLTVYSRLSPAAPLTQPTKRWPYSNLPAHVTCDKFINYRGRKFKAVVNVEGGAKCTCPL